MKHWQPDKPYHMRIFFLRDCKQPRFCLKGRTIWVLQCSLFRVQTSQGTVEMVKLRPQGCVVVMAGQRCSWSEQRHCGGGSVACRLQPSINCWTQAILQGSESLTKFPRQRSALPLTCHKGLFCCSCAQRKNGLTLVTMLQNLHLKCSWNQKLALPGLVPLHDQAGGIWCLLTLRLPQEQ